jgi:hypothetical protein
MGKQDSCVETVRAALRKHPGFIAEAFHCVDANSAEAIADAYVTGNASAVMSAIAAAVNAYLGDEEERIADLIQGKSLTYCDPSDERVLECLGDIWEVAA